MIKCPVCDQAFESGNYGLLSHHLIEQASNSDAGHITWLNRNLTHKKTDEVSLEILLRKFYDLEEKGVKDWIKRLFIRKFFDEPPHPFVKAMQKPSNGLLKGYVMEHHYFLRQWIKSCAFVIAKTDYEDVQMYELDNIFTELHGYGQRAPSHHELLLRMGESLGLTREQVLNTEPLPDTLKSIEFWNKVAKEGHWIEGMTAMHSLELIANKRLKEEGAKYGYFDSSILKGEEYPSSVKDFLREGYEADVGHSEEALNLIEKYSELLGMKDEVQWAFLKSVDAFDRYLSARLERGRMYEDKL